MFKENQTENVSHEGNEKNTVSKYRNLVHEKEKGVGNLPSIIYDPYTLEEVESVLSSQSELADKYFSMVEKYGNLTDIINLFKNGPEYAKNLFEVLKQRPELLRTYSLFLLRGNEGHKDSPFMESRISTTTSLEVVQNYIDKLNNLREAISKTQFTKEGQTDTMLNYLEIVNVSISKIFHPNPEKSGLMIGVIPVGQGYDFSSLRFTLTNVGEISSRRNTSDKLNFGYLTREDGKIGEMEIMEILARYNIESNEFEEAFEPMAEKLTAIQK